MLDDIEDEQERFKAVPTHGKGTRGKRKADKVKSPEVMAIRRRKLWAMMSKKELAKVSLISDGKFSSGRQTFLMVYIRSYRVRDRK